jgi:S-adenosylmethionine-dependent methyltransferase
MTELSKITKFYNVGTDDEYLRLTKSPIHEAEFELTIDLLKEYIAPKSSVFDIGAGPGRYAEFLLQELSCKVGLVDLAESALETFLHRNQHLYRENVLFVKKSSATTLDWLESASADTILLMGPLYHLKEEQERLTAIAQCWRILKPGGYIFAAFLSPYGGFIRLLNDDAALLFDRNFITQLLEFGITESTYQNMTIEFYRCWPSQAKEMMEKGGFEKLRLRNLEGMTPFLSEEQKQLLYDPMRKKAWFDILRSTCENPDILGATLHFLYVGQKPK